MHTTRLTRVLGNLVEDYIAQASDELGEWKVQTLRPDAFILVTHDKAQFIVTVAQLGAREGYRDRR